MPSKEIEFSSPVRCGHCGNLAPMEIVASYSNLQEVPDDSCPPYEFGDSYQLLHCPACDAVMLRAYFWHEGYMESKADVSFRILYPSDVRLPSGLPSAIEKALVAALKVKPIDSNAFGTLIGRVIELVCVDRNASGYLLGNKLADLAKRGEIPAKLVGVAEGLANLRNVAAHPVLGELTPEEVPIVEDLCRALLEYIYSAPHLAQKAQDRLDALKQHRGKSASASSAP